MLAFACIDSASAQLLRTRKKLHLHENARESSQLQVNCTINFLDPSRKGWRQPRDRPPSGIQAVSRAVSSFGVGFGEGTGTNPGIQITNTGVIW